MKNLDSRPRNCKLTAKYANVATNNQVGYSHVELMLMTMPKKMLPDSIKFLLDPNIMVVDTGSSCDKTPHNKGFFNLKDATEEASIQANSGENMISTKVGNFPLVQCTKYGEEVQGLTLKEMTLTPDANLIIFSLTKIQKE